MLYDYEAVQSTELTVSEEDILYVYDKDDAWMLVRKESDDSRVGYVPGNYVEEVRRVLYSLLQRPHTCIGHWRGNIRSRISSACDITDRRATISVYTTTLLRRS